MDKDREPEEWRDVVGYELIYGISDWARVRRISTRRILKQLLDTHGCPIVGLYLHGKRTLHRVAHLVANAFLPPKSSTDQVLRHLNDNPADNRIENLTWGTYKDNAKDSIRNDTFVRGITHGMAKLTEDDVREIRRLYATGKFLLRDLALQFGVSNATICLIVRRKSWKHIL